MSPLPSLFDGNIASFCVFLAELSDKALLYNWCHILAIPVSDDGITKNLLTQYGTISLTNILNHYNVYLLEADGCYSQDNQWMYHCVMSSITKEVKSKVILSSALHYLRGISSRPLLLRILI